jgi:hypothetical protein
MIDFVLLRKDTSVILHIRPHPLFHIIPNLLFTNNHTVKFEVSGVVSVKSHLFWEVTPCGSSKNQRFGGTCHFHRPLLWSSGQSF